MLTRDPALFRTPGVTPVVASQVHRALGDRVVVLDDFQANPDLGLSSSGTLVSYDVANLVEGKLDDADSVFTASVSDPMNGMTQSDNDADAARGVVFDWNVGDNVSFEIGVPAAEPPRMLLLVRLLPGSGDLLDDLLSETRHLLHDTAQTALVGDLLDLDEVYHLLDHPAERRRIGDHHLRTRTAQAEPLENAARVLDLADLATLLTNAKERVHVEPPSPP